MTRKRNWIGFSTLVISLLSAPAAQARDFYVSAKRGKGKKGTKDKPAKDIGNIVKKLKAGDVILKFNDKAIDEMRDLPRIVADTPAGSTVQVEVWIPMEQLETLNDGDRIKRALREACKHDKQIESVEVVFQ